MACIDIAYLRSMAYIVTNLRELWGAAPEPGPGPQARPPGQAGTDRKQRKKGRPEMPQQREVDCEKYTYVCICLYTHIHTFIHTYVYVVAPCLEDVLLAHARGTGASGVPAELTSTWYVMGTTTRADEWRRYAIRRM